MENSILSRLLIIKEKYRLAEQEIRRSLNLTESEFRALLAMSKSDSHYGNELSQKLNLSVSRGSRVLARLRAKEYVSVTYNDEDRRSVSISLTEKGFAKKNDIHAACAEIEARMFAVFSEAESGLLLRLLTKLAGYLEESDMT